MFENLDEQILTHELVKDFAVAILQGNADKAVHAVKTFVENCNDILGAPFDNDEGLDVNMLAADPLDIEEEDVLEASPFGDSYSEDNETDNKHAFQIAVLQISSEIFNVPLPSEEPGDDIEPLIEKIMSSGRGSNQNASFAGHALIRAGQELKLLPQ